MNLRMALRMILPLLLTLMAVGLMAACGGDDATEAPAAATEAPVAATSAPAGTAAPAATQAPTGPTATSAPRPTTAQGQVIPTVAPTEAVADAAKTWPDAYPKVGENGIPADTGKFTVAMDSWGSSDLNPWAATQVNFLGDYYNLRLMMQDPNGVLAPAWALSFEQTLDGLTFQLNPDARFQDGTPADGEALKTNLLGFRGDFVEQAGYDAPLWNSAKATELTADVEVISPTEVFVKTDGGKPTWMWNLGGNGYHLYWY